MIKKITKDMTFLEIIEKHPEVAEILFEKGMHCVGCGMASMESIEQGALAHGMDIDELVDELNSRLEGREPSFLRKKRTLGKKRTKDGKKKSKKKPLKKETKKPKLGKVWRREK
ncbi:DUF1858 domain-containing protein [archaeon]|jgi:hybrid cluster-associated redox disulfide protein|nr:DUF1858 domain-containing protein [archaeon]MBT4241525.1 DUF1858 domain-containing protein [archaeon]MBT4417604.1 DUF1858 domain-containing protein [archaeon]